jgi:hypothetical protein
MSAMHVVVVVLFALVVVVELVEAAGSIFALVVHSRGQEERSLLRRPELN